MTEQSPKEIALAAINELGLTMECKFVPWSQSRNKEAEYKTLNWVVTIKRNGRDVITTDYAAGCGHCSAKASVAPSTYRARDRFNSSGKPYPGTTSNYRAPTESEKLSDFIEEWRNEECERGIALVYNSMGTEKFKPKRVKGANEFKTETVPILPDICDVMYSLNADSSVLNNSGFEDWANEYGYEIDSRKAEKIYRECLEIALKIKAAIGADGMEKLATVFQDY